MVIRFMKVTLLGTGYPIPMLDRAGTSVVVTVDDDPLLVDCGPGIVYHLVKHEIHPAKIESLFFQPPPLRSRRRLLPLRPR